MKAFRFLVLLNFVVNESGHDQLMQHRGAAACDVCILDPGCWRFTLVCLGHEM